MNVLVAEELACHEELLHQLAAELFDGDHTICREVFFGQAEIVHEPRDGQ